MNRLNFGGLSIFIYSAVSFAEPWLSFYRNEDTSPVSAQYLPSLEIPHLQALVLDFAMVNVPALLMFLRMHAAALKSIELCCFDSSKWLLGNSLPGNEGYLFTLELSSISGFNMRDNIMNYWHMSYKAALIE